MWKQSQNDVWKFFSFSLNWNFQKRSLNQRQSDLDFESKTKMTAESPFHFIELRLSNKIITTGAGWPFLWKHGKITAESPFHFIELRLCLSFCCKRKVMTCFRWNSTNLKPSFSSCGFYVTSKHLRCSQQILFCLNFCGQFSLCESLIKARILMYRVHEFFFPEKI